MAPVCTTIGKELTRATGSSDTPCLSDPSPALVGLAAKLLRLQSCLSKHHQDGLQLVDASLNAGYEPSAPALDMGSLSAVASGLDAEFRTSIANNDFYYEYQPIVCAVTGAAKGYEALARWRRRGRSVSAAFFLPVAEETGSIIAIQQQLLSEIASIYSALSPKMSLGINWSPAQLSETQAVTDFINRVRELRIDSRRIVIEITEHTVTMNPGATYASVLRLKDQGFRVALDDFGRAHCGLSYLYRLPIDQVKIDGSLIRDLGESPRSALILDAIVDLAHKLGNEVVAEGVETEQQLSALRYAGCDFVQGHLIGYPSRHLLPESTTPYSTPRCAAAVSATHGQFVPGMQLGASS